MSEEALAALYSVIFTTILYTSMFYLTKKSLHTKYEKLYEVEFNTVLNTAMLRTSLFQLTVVQESMFINDFNKVLVKVSGKKITKKNIFRVSMQNIDATSLVLMKIYDKIYGEDYYQWSRKYGGAGYDMKNEISDEMFISKRPLIKKELDRLMDTPMEQVARAHNMVPIKRGRGYKINKVIVMVDDRCDFCDSDGPSAGSSVCHGCGSL